MNKSSYGFTLVELLLVVSIIGLLTGIAIVVINPIRQQNIAKDSINKKNMLKISEGIEASNIAKNSSLYPDNMFEEDVNNFPLLNILPSDTPPSLVYKTSSSKSDFCLCLPSLVNVETYFWYSSINDKLEERVDSCDKSCE